MSAPDERLLPVDLGIPCDPGAPDPVVIQTERGATIVFNLLPANGDESTTGVISFVDFRALLDARADEETLDGHRLWDQGLSGLPWIYEVENSGWAKIVDSMRLRSQCTDGNRPSRHFIFVFHDSTLEVAALGFRFAALSEPRSRIPVLNLARWDDSTDWPSLTWSAVW